MLAIEIVFICSKRSFDWGASTSIRGQTDPATRKPHLTNLDLNLMNRERESIYPFICVVSFFLFVYLYVSSTYLSICVSVCLPIFQCIYVHLSVCLSVCKGLLICQSICLCIRVSAIHSFQYICISNYILIYSYLYNHSLPKVTDVTNSHKKYLQPHISRSFYFLLQAKGINRSRLPVITFHHCTYN